MPNKVIKVLHIISDLRRGGKERQLSILTNYSSSIENHILSFHENKNSYLNEYNFKHLGYIGQGKFSRIKDIRNYIKKNNINLVHTWGNSETIYGAIAAKLAGIPILNGSIRHGIRLNTFSHRFRSLILKGSHFVLGNSRAGFEANGLKIKNKRHFVIYNGIEEKFFIPFDKTKREIFNKNYKLTEKGIVFISIANFIPYKDYSTILCALSEIEKELDFHYIMIGKGPLLNETKKIISDLRLDNKITIHSDNPDIPSLLSISDILIHSSLGEGCSNAILESSAAGNVVVASNTGGTKEIINPWSFLYQYKNAHELKIRLEEAINLLSNEPGIREKIQNETRKRFSINSFVDNYKNLVYQILNPY